ncbi:hypothetical protein MASR1M45_16520 [Candidatus Kapaibacterium sp.]
MKKAFLILMTYFMLSCNTDESNVKEFTDIYYDILMIREKYLDTNIANPKIADLLKKYGYDEQSFKEYSYEIFSKNPQMFTAIIDSVRNKAERNLLEFGKERQRKLDSINQQNNQ